MTRDCVGWLDSTTCGCVVTLAGTADSRVHTDCADHLLASELHCSNRVTMRFTLLSSLVLSTLMATASAQPQAAMVWQTQLSSDYGTVGVTLSNGTLFTVAGSTLYALNATNGNVIWNATGSDYAQFATPVVVDGIVIVITTQTTAWNATTGAYLWTSNQPTPPTGIAVSVDLETRTVFVSVQPSTTFPAPLVALSLDTGLLKWQAAVGQLTNVETGYGPAAVAADKGIVSFYTQSGYLLGSDISTGALVWSVESLNADALTAVFYACDTIVVIQSGIGVYGYNVTTGLQVWQSGYFQYASDYAVIANCTMYAVQDGITAMDVRTGAVLWSALTAAAYDNLAMPVLVRDEILAVSYTGIFMLDALTGNVTLNVSLPPYGDAAPQVQYGNDTVYYMIGGIAYAVSTVKTLPMLNISICSDAGCQQCPDQFEAPAGQCATDINNENSVMRQCTRNDVIVSAYSYSGTCLPTYAPVVTNYTIGLCYPLLAGGYIKFNSCSAFP
jgi:outer membrane protein assembly factor BamB